MSVFKRKYNSGKTAWCYVFDAPWSTPTNRAQLKGSGFATKKKAADAEIERRFAANREHDDRQRAATAPPPRTLGQLLMEYFQEAGRNLAPKTLERYKELAAYLDSTLLAQRINDIGPLNLSREWTRLLECGGRHRKTKAARPLAAKTVRGVASVVSTAYAQAIGWGLVTANPVVGSNPPVFQKKRSIALTPEQVRLVIEAAVTPWWLSAFLEMDHATGARRGELLALRWSDIRDGVVTVGASLSQTRGALTVKSTKEHVINEITLAESALKALATHRMIQGKLRREFGEDYRTDLDLVFSTPEGNPLRPDSVSATISALFRRLKMPPGTSLHTLRHTHGSHLLAAGVPLPVVSRRLGHKSVKTTADVYAHALPGGDADATKRWERLQGGAVERDTERGGKTQ